ncbi:hypothetical protein ABT255_09330 [Streptomyces mirabilis]
MTPRDRLGWCTPTPPSAAHGGEGSCRGVSARSGWRVNAAKSVIDRFRA